MESDVGSPCVRLATLLVPFIVILFGCGGGPGSPQQAPSIATQPASQSVPLGQTATFAVSANGSAPISYQWQENRTAIVGATAASYTTTDVTTGDSGSEFTVTVSNAAGSVTSNPATLTVGPRSPKAGDLRFQQVGAPTEAEQGTADAIVMTFPKGAVNGWPNAVGSPLQIGAQGGCFELVTPDSGCGWTVWATALPPDQSGLNAAYNSGSYSNFDSDLNRPGVFDSPPDAPDSVITSVDFNPAYNAYAIGWAQTTQGGGFDLRREIVAPGAVPTTVAQDAEQSRVITAVSFDANGRANLFSYGWQGDTRTVYDTQVVSIPAEGDQVGQTVTSAAQSLADEGYILTAFGGDATNGFLLIGTKVRGDSLPRPIFDQACPQGGCTKGYAPVIFSYASILTRPPAAER